MNVYPSLTLLLLAAPAIAQDDSDARLEQLVGEFAIEARVWPAPGADPLPAHGSATWTRSHGDRFVHEHFELETAGQLVEGDAWIAWMPKAKRYELTQIDAFHPRTTWLTGAWDAQRERIVLRDDERARPEGFAAQHWEFGFDEESGFRKELFKTDAEGTTWLASEYRYVPVDERGRPRAPEGTEVSGVTRLPMIEGFNWVVIDVELNGKGPYRMILDTGAGVTVLNEDLVEELGLTATGTRRIGDPSNPRAEEVDELTVDTVRIGGASFTGVEAVGWRGGLVSMDGIRGVLGFPTFADCLVTLDYPGAQVEIRPGHLPEPDGAEVLALKVGGTPSIPIEVGGFPMQAHLDAGNSGSLILPATWLERLPIVEGTRSKGAGRRASGPFEFTSARIDAALMLGDQVIASPMVNFDETLPVVNVGHEILSQFAVTFDQSGGRVRFARPDGDQPVRAGAPRRLGMQMAARGGAGFSATMVVPGSAAETAGLLVGDELIEVGGEPFSQKALLDALRTTGSFEITIERAGERKKLTFFGE
ncbi:MAG: DUF1579 domain-containing protein [bacterium]|nr:DUF1579 domain-containing protein [bacterium]